MIVSAQLSPDGRYLVTTLTRRSLLWDLASIRDRLAIPGLAEGWPRYPQAQATLTSPAKAFRLLIDPGPEERKGDPRKESAAAK